MCVIGPWFKQIACKKQLIRSKCCWPFFPLFAHSLFFKERLEQFTPVVLFKRATVSNLLRLLMTKERFAISLTKKKRITWKTNERIPNPDVRYCIYSIFFFKKSKLVLIFTNIWFIKYYSSVQCRVLKTLWILGSYTDRQVATAVYTIQQTEQLYRQVKGISIFDYRGVLRSLRI